MAYFFNQICTAPANSNGQTFTCYQNNPNTDFSEYTAAIARLNPESCDREIFENEQPLFWYVKEASEDGATESTFGLGRPNTDSSMSFDQSEAVKTFYSTLGASGSGGGGGDNSGGSSGAMETRCGRMALVVAGLMLVFT